MLEEAERIQEVPYSRSKTKRKTEAERGKSLKTQGEKFGHFPHKKNEGETEDERQDSRDNSGVSISIGFVIRGAGPLEGALFLDYHLGKSAARSPFKGGDLGKKTGRECHHR